MTEKPMPVTVLLSLAACRPTLLKPAHRSAMTLTPFAKKALNNIFIKLAIYKYTNSFNFLTRLTVVSSKPASVNSN